MSDKATGGFVSGPVPVHLYPGDFIINAAAARRLAPGLLERLNRRPKPDEEADVD